MSEYSIPQFLFLRTLWTEVADIKRKTKITLTFSSNYAIKKLATYSYMKLLTGGF